MQSVFGFHNLSRAKAFCYATTARDNSVHRQQIDEDGIHILVNLNGYTRGARNEIFAARPAPIQMSFMGFAGTLGAEWCDYLLADATAIPPPRCGRTGEISISKMFSATRLPPRPMTGCTLRI